VRTVPILALAVSPFFAIAQTKAGSNEVIGAAQAGNCSIAAVGTVSNVRIICNGVPRQDAERFRQLLNGLLVDQKTMTIKLDALQAQLQILNTTVANTPLNTLGSRAVEYSNQIEKFLQNRGTQEPQQDTKVDQNIDTGKLHALQEDFRRQYWRGLKDLRDEFAAHYLHDSSLDSEISLWESRDNLELDAQVLKGQVGEEIVSVQPLIQSLYAGETPAQIIDSLAKSLRILACRLPTLNDIQRRDLSCEPPPPPR
jgi:hypothetical protein